MTGRRRRPRLYEERIAGLSTGASPGSAGGRARGVQPLAGNVDDTLTYPTEDIPDDGGGGGGGGGPVGGLYVYDPRSSWSTFPVNTAQMTAIDSSWGDYATYLALVSGKWTVQVECVITVEFKSRVNVAAGAAAIGTISHDAAFGNITASEANTNTGPAYKNVPVVLLPWLFVPGNDFDFACSCLPGTGTVGFIEAMFTIFPAP